MGFFEVCLAFGVEGQQAIQIRFVPITFPDECTAEGLK